MLSESERAAILDAEIGRQAMQGFRVISRTATTAQLVRPKQFSAAAAILGLLVLVVGLLIYLAVYAAQSDELLYLTVEADGTLKRAGSGVKRDRWPCERCGYQNHAARVACKGCRAVRA